MVLLGQISRFMHHNCAALPKTTCTVQTRLIDMPVYLLVLPLIVLDSRDKSPKIVDRLGVTLLQDSYLSGRVYLARVEVRFPPAVGLVFPTVGKLFNASCRIRLR